MIESCYCPSYYNLNNGNCLKTRNWIEIIYNITYTPEKCFLMNTFYSKIELDEIDVYIISLKYFYIKMIHFIRKYIFIVGIKEQKH